MGSLKNFFSRKNQDAEWQDAVIARLDSLAESQRKMSEELAEHAIEGRPTSRGRLRAFTYLSISVGLIIISVSATIISSTFQSQATTASNQAQAAGEQVNKDLQPIEAIVTQHGASYLYAHPSKALLADVQAADEPAQQVSKYDAEENHFDDEWIASEYFGQTVLAISSACFGAIAGWLLIPVLVEGRRSQQGKSSSRKSAQ